MHTVQIYTKVNPKDMAFLKFIVESYEGLAVLRTVDPKEGIIEWMVAPDLVDQAEELIDCLRDEIPIEPISPLGSTPSALSPIESTGEPPKQEKEEP